MLGNNIKVHFAGSDGQADAGIALRSAGVNYNLYSVYGYILNKTPESNFRLPRDDVLKMNDDDFKHVIQDSGLFTLMFGAQKGKVQTVDTLTIWQDKLIEFVLQNNLKSTCVEIDCQKVLGVEEAWYFRERMKQKLPNNRIINVFHFEDGMKGLDRLIEFAEYIAISVPEIRIIKRKTYKEDVAKLAHYIKQKKPEIDIHLLGCTELDMLRQNKFCTSADSTSWITGMRYGNVNMTKHHEKEIGKEILRKRMCICKMIADQKGVNIETTQNSLQRTAKMSICASICKKEYETAAGSQD